MILSALSDPVGLALDWSEVKGQLRLDSEEERAWIESVVVPGVTTLAETITNRQLVTRTWAAWFSSFDAACRAALAHPKYPSETILVPKPPLQSVTWIKYYDTANTLQTWAASDYVVTTPAGEKAGPGMIRPAPSVTWPGTYARPDAVEVKFVAGYGDLSAAVPPLLRQGLLLLVAELFKNREHSVTGTIEEVPLNARSLIDAFLVEI